MNRKAVPRLAKKPFEERKAASDNENPLNHIITKFLRNGFKALTIEDLATAMINPNFGELFKDKTGEDWDEKYKPRAIEQLAGSKLDLRWLENNTSNQFTPLFTLCKLGKIEDVKEYIDKNGNDTLFAVDSSMRSPLHIAAANNHSKLVEILISKGSNIEARDKSLRTPLQLAAHTGSLKAVETLISLGADLLAKDSVTRIHYSR